MGLLAKNPENRYGSAAALAGDLRRSLERLPPTFAAAAGYSETVRSPAVAAVLAPANTEGGGRPGSLLSKPGRKRSIGVGLMALVALLALLGTLGGDLSRTPERVSAVRAIRTLGAPEGFGGARGDNEGKGTGSGTPSAGRGGGASVPASTSAVPASVPSSAPTASEPPASEPQVSEPQAPKPQAAAPFSSSQAPEGSSGSGGQGAGTINPGGGESAAQEQYQ
jgi:hypothetical protein